MKRVGIIGCGRIAGGFDRPEDGDVWTHVKAFSRVAGAEVSAVADIDVARARAFADRWGVAAAYGDWSDMCRNHAFDLLCVCTPTATHAEILAGLLALPSPPAILCEKPVTATAAEARAVLQLADAKNVPVWVNYIRRWDQRFRHIKQQLQAGHFGPVVHVTGQYTRGLYNNGSHLINLLRWWFGDPQDVNLLSNPTTAPAQDPTPSFQLRFAGGIEATLLGLNLPQVNIFEVDLLGREGRLCIRGGGRQIRTAPIRLSQRFSGLHELGPATDQPATLHLAMHAAAECILSGQTADAPTLQDALKDLLVIEAVLGCRPAATPTDP